jgi:hypothetical protein
MSYQQLKAPNLSQTGVVGGCLAYAREMFGAPGGVDYAWQAWENAKYKHEASEALPTDAAVLLWYSYDGNEGHVTVNVPGIGIYSSPWQAGTTHAVLASVAQVEQYYTTHLDGGTQPVVYVGWSEDINGVRVAEPVAAPAPAPSGQTISLPASATAWHVYNVAGPYTLAHATHVLDPAKFGGLKYTVVRWIVPNSIAVINTTDFGQVAIYVASGTGAVIS